MQWAEKLKNTICEFVLRSEKLRRKLESVNLNKSPP